MTQLCKCRKNNSGYSLIELIVVISIMSVMVGMVSLGVGIVFSKDAAKCATRLNDSIYSARSDSMSKTGKYVLTIDNTAAANIAVISVISTDESGTETKSEVETTYLDDSDDSKKTTVTAKFVTGAGAEADLTLPVALTFDKAKGNVIFDYDSDGTNDDGIIVFDIKAVRGSRESKVQLVTTTGKHTVGDFK